MPSGGMVTVVGLACDWEADAWLVASACRADARRRCPPSAGPHTTSATTSASPSVDPLLLVIASSPSVPSARAVRTRRSARERGQGVLALDQLVRLRADDVARALELTVEQQPADLLGLLQERPQRRARQPLRHISARVGQRAPHRS